jgi:hypothetical protein
MTAPTRTPDVTAGRPAGRPRQAALPLAPTVLDRLDPDGLHPGRIAGAYAWTAWNLTSQPTHGDLTILVPHRDGNVARHELLDRLELSLQLPTWREPGSLPCTRRGSSLAVRLASGPCQIHVTSHPWYLPDTSRPCPGAVVDRRGFPLIDEHTAVRERFERIADHGPTHRDVTDVVHWVESHRTPTGRTPNLGSLLHRLHRDAPQTRQALDDVVGHARRHYIELRHTPGLDTAMQTVTDLSVAHRQPRSRAR